MPIFLCENDLIMQTRPSGFTFKGSRLVLKVRGLIITNTALVFSMTKDENSILRCFGKRVRNLREARGLSQEQFAHLTDLDRSYIGGVERGQRNISLKNLEKIATALEMSLEELLGGVK